MAWLRGRNDLIETIEVRTRGRGMHEITALVEAVVRRSGLDEGLCTVMIQHTSASLIIQENADASARRDLESWMERHVPEGDLHFTHTAEGPDDMPSHIRAALTCTTLSVPFTGGRLALGTWQGIWLWEHRTRGSGRRCVVHIGG
jgi:secondary thiamine-phosphate synthase enzyme